MILARVDAYGIAPNAKCSFRLVVESTSFAGVRWHMVLVLNVLMNVCLCAHLRSPNTKDETSKLAQEAAGGDGRRMQLAVAAWAFRALP